MTSLPSYKEENIHITTNSIFALIFSYGGYIQWGILKNLENLLGSRPLNLAGVAVAVFNEQGQILLQQRRNGIWGVPGGFVELGESTEEAGRREVLEETGIEIGKLTVNKRISGKEFFVKLPNGDEFLSYNNRISLQRH